MSGPQGWRFTICLDDEIGEERGDTNQSFPHGIGRGNWSRTVARAFRCISIRNELFLALHARATVSHWLRHALFSETVFGSARELFVSRLSIARERPYETISTLEILILFG